VQFRTISGREQRFVVSRSGSGPDVVLLHGFPDTPHSYSELEAALASSGWRVTVPWLRGYHPETIVPDRPYDAVTLGRDVLALLAALEPQRVRALVALAIPHPSLLERTPGSLWAARHFFALKLPWAARSARRNDFAYFDRLYSRWAPNWSGSTREESLDHAKAALSSPETLDGAIDYYRALSLGPRPAALDRPAPVPGLIVGGTADLVAAELFTATAALLPAPSRALIVERAGHWPHLEDPGTVVPEILRFVSQL
jgi:pimeloyl-ACP methyl ester carboxylesterase